LRERPALTDVREGGLELLGECVEHRGERVGTAAPPATTPMRTVGAVLTVKRAVYLLLSLGLGTTWFLILVVGLATGIGLLVTLLRLPSLLVLLLLPPPLSR